MLLYKDIPCVFSALSHQCSGVSLEYFTGHPRVIIHVLRLVLFTDRKGWKKLYEKMWFSLQIIKLPKPVHTANLNYRGLSVWCFLDRVACRPFALTVGYFKAALWCSSSSRCWIILSSLWVQNMGKGLVWGCVSYFGIEWMEDGWSLNEMKFREGLKAVQRAQRDTCLVMCTCFRCFWFIVTVAWKAPSFLKARNYTLTQRSVFHRKSSETSEERGFVLRATGSFRIHNSVESSRASLWRMP